MKRFYVSFNLSTKLGGYCLMIDVAIGSEPTPEAVVTAYMEKKFKGLWSCIYPQIPADMTILNVDPERLFYSDARYV